MLLYLHPTRHEALTASETAITRWSLDTNPAIILARFSTAPRSVFHFMYSQSGQRLIYGGVTGSPDGLLFAHEQLKEDERWGTNPCVVEWRSFNDLLPVRASTVPHTAHKIGSLASAPDGRWLVLESAGRLFLLNWQTGEVLSRHDTGVSYTNGLTFDATSTFVAGVFWDEGGFLQLWQLDPAERFVSRPAVQDWQTHERAPQDYVSGSMALTLVYEDSDRAGIEWPDRYLADAPGWVKFSPDSRIVLFSLNSSIRGGGCALVAFEVPSGKLLWSVRHAVESSGEGIFSPDGRMLLLPERDGDLRLYRSEDGLLEQHLPIGLSEPVQALAFDHDGKTLWLATEDQLVQYQP
jgi:WD40 repeat protein